jgi:hypothetical protein
MEFLLKSMARQKPEVVWASLLNIELKEGHKK